MDAIEAFTMVFLISDALLNAKAISCVMPNLRFEAPHKKDVKPSYISSFILVFFWFI